MHFFSLPLKHRKPYLEIKILVPAWEFFLPGPLKWLLFGSSTEHDTKWQFLCIFIIPHFVRTLLHADVTGLYTWCHSGHVGGQEQNYFSPLGTKLYFHVNSLRKIILFWPPTWPLCHVVAKPRNPTSTRIIILFQTLEKTSSKVAVSPVQSC